MSDIKTSGLRQLSYRESVALALAVSAEQARGVLDIKKVEPFIVNAEGLFPLLHDAVLVAAIRDGAILSPKWLEEQGIAPDAPVPVSGDDEISWITGRPIRESGKNDSDFAEVDEAMPPKPTGMEHVSDGKFRDGLEGLRQFHEEMKAGDAPKTEFEVGKRYRLRGGGSVLITGALSDGGPMGKFEDGRENGWYAGGRWLVGKQHDNDLMPGAIEPSVEIPNDQPMLDQFGRQWMVRTDMQTGERRAFVAGRPQASLNYTVRGDDTFTVHPLMPDVRLRAAGAVGA